MQHLPKLREPMFLLRQPGPPKQTLHLRQHFGNVLLEVSNASTAEEVMSGDGVIVSGRKSRPDSSKGIPSAESARLRSPPRDRPIPSVDFLFGSEGHAVLDCFVVTCGSRFQGRLDFFFHDSSNSAETACCSSGTFPFRLRVAFAGFTETAIAHGDHACAALRMTSASSRLRSRNSTRSSTEFAPARRCR